MILGITGKAGSGKDEFGKIACNEFDFNRADFSDTLKKQLKEELLDKYNFYYEERHLYGTQVDKEEILNFGRLRTDYPDWFYDFIEVFNVKTNMRSLMQYYGTEVYRNQYGENYWIDKTLNDLDNNKDYVVCSTRFLNEAQAIKDKGGYLIKVIRSNAPGISNMNHPSEIELEQIEYDYLIDNNGTLEEYHNKCRKVLNDLILLKNWR